MKKVFFIFLFALGVPFSSCNSSEKKDLGKNRLSAKEPVDIKKVMSKAPAWSYDFEQGWNAEHGKGSLENKSSKAKKWRYSQMQSKEAGKVIGDPKNKDNKVMRFVWKKNAGRQYDTNTQKKAHLYGNFGANSRQKEVWSFRVYFPSNSMLSDNRSEIIVQWHGHPDKNEAMRNPPLALDNRLDKLTVSWLYDERKMTPPRFRKWNRKSVDLGTTPKDKWVQFIFDINWGPDGSGALRIWIDDQIKVDEQNIAIGFNDEVGPYIGFGIYKFENTSQHKNRALLFDDFAQWVY